MRENPPHVEARTSLENRLHHLEHERIPQLERDVVDSNGDVSLLMVLQAARTERARVREALRAWNRDEEPSHDPSIVEPGDTVTVRAAEHGKRETFTIVGPVEARFNESWISSESPLGSALLGRTTGEAVKVRAPRGTITYKVLRIQRLA